MKLTRLLMAALICVALSGCATNRGRVLDLTNERPTTNVADFTK